jgi:hypothetical protein
MRLIEIIDTQQSLPSESRHVPKLPKTRLSVPAPLVPSELESQVQIARPRPLTGEHAVGIHTVAAKCGDALVMPHGEGGVPARLSAEGAHLVGPCIPALGRETGPLAPCSKMGSPPAATGMIPSPSHIYNLKP